MFVNGINVLSIDFRGEMSHGVPVRGEFDATLAKFNLNFSQETRLFRDHGKMKSNLIISTKSKTVFENSLDAKLKLTDAGELSFSKINTNCRIFPLEIIAKIDYGKIDSYTRNFINEFNQNTSVGVYSMERHLKIGEVYLVERDKSDKLNLAVRYEDGSIEYLEDLILSVEAIFNVKIE